MAYTKQAWVDNVTPVDAARMLHLEDGVEMQVDVDSVVPSAGQLVASKLLAGDANPAFKIVGDGQHLWGPGGAGGLDTSFGRSAAGSLKASAHLRAGQDLYAQDGAAQQVRIGNSSGNAAIDFGSAMDTSLYRGAVSVLSTDGRLTVGGFDAGIANSMITSKGASPTVNVFAGWALGDIQYRFMIDASGKLQWGTGNAGFDTNLYRAAAATLKTDGYFRSVGEVIARDTQANQTMIGYTAGGQAGVTFGSASDTNLYRASAGVLGSGGAFSANHGAATQVYIGATGGGYAGVQFGSAFDANLYRSAAAILSTDGEFVIRPTYGATRMEFGAYGSAAQAGIRFGTDTNLYRAGVDALMTDDDFYSASNIVARLNTAYMVTMGAAGPSSQAGFSLGNDTNLYRNSANWLRTDGHLSVGGQIYPGSYIQWLAGGYTLLSSNSGDTANRFMLAADGKHEWGPGNVATLDTNLFRIAASHLRTDGNFNVGGVHYQYGNILMDPGGVGAGIHFGAASDTHLYRSAAGVLKTDGVFVAGSFTSAAYGTSFPASPVDGQEYTLVDSVTNPTWVWRFRYNASYTGTAKWEFIGGTDKQGTPIDGASNTSVQYPSFEDLGGPYVQAPRAGSYLSIMNVQGTNSVAGCYALAGPSFGAGGMNNTDLGLTTAAAANAATTMSRQSAHPGVAAGDTFRILYAALGGGTASFERRQLFIRPIRVS